MTVNTRNQIPAILVIALVLVVGAGCRKNSTEPTSPGGVNSSQDAAQSIANAVGEDNGGVADQMGDIADATGSSGISANVGAYWTEGSLMKSTTTTSDTIIKTFNTSDTSWTVYVSRSRVGFLGRRAGFTRTYYVKFIDQNGVALPRYATTSPADTAATILFKILNGSGYTETQYVSTHLVSISADFAVTGANTQTITVNGTFTRAGTDTVITPLGERVLSHTLTATLQNVKGPRTPRYQSSTRIPRATGGTVTGTYVANVTVVRGNSYTDRSFTKTFTITFGSNGTGAIDVDGTQYTCNTTYGELTGG